MNLAQRRYFESIATRSVALARSVRASLQPSQVHVPTSVGEEKTVKGKAVTCPACGSSFEMSQRGDAEGSKRELRDADSSVLCLYATKDPSIFRLTPVTMGAKFEPEEDGRPPRSWIQLARIGKYRGHPQGPFEFTPAVFETIVQNFKRTVNREVPIDFEHATELPGSEGSIPQDGAPATGFCVDMRSGGTSGLFGLIEWLEPGLGYVRSGRYRRFSPAVSFDAVDPATGAKLGPQMTSGALTNRPFLDGMTRLVASAKAA